MELKNFFNKINFLHRKSQFINPQGYLQYLQQKNSTSLKTLYDRSFNNYVIESLGRKIKLKPYENDLMQMFDLVCTSPTTDAAMTCYEIMILRALSENQKKNFQKHLAFGEISSTRKEAYIAKSSEKYFAIVFTSGLFKFILGITNLHLARDFPKWYKLSNSHHKHIESNFEKIKLDYYNNEKDITQFVDALKINIEYRHIVIIYLYFFELFTICHELGHFFNCDFSDRSNLMLLNDDNEISALVSGKNHLMEYKADLFGCVLMLHVLVGNHAFPSFDVVIKHLQVFFDIMQYIQPASTYSHPSPIQRICNISMKLFPNDDMTFVIGQTYKMHPEFIAFCKYVNEHKSLIDLSPKKEWEFVFAK